MNIHAYTLSEMKQLHRLLAAKHFYEVCYECFRKRELAALLREAP
jgi:hypothetical protein